MNIRMSSKDFSVFPALWERIERKINKLGRYFDPDTEVQVRLSAEGKRRIAEITIPFKGGILRAEECTNDMYQSIDNALIKIERQIRRHRTRLEKRLRQGAFERSLDGEITTFAPEEPEEGEYTIVRSKKFSLKPMTREEAILQMNLLGHSFFAFRDEENEGKFAVVYHRNDGGYGIIEDEE